MKYSLKGYYYDQGYKKADANGTNLKTNPGGDFTTPREEKLFTIIVPSIIAQWLNFLTYVVLLFVYGIG